MSAGLAALGGAALSHKEVACRTGFRIGGVSVEVMGSADNGDVALVSSLEPFRSEIAAPDITVHIERVAALTDSPTPPQFDSGCTWRLYARELGAQFDFYIKGFTYKRLLINEQFSRAQLQMSEDAIAALGYSVPALDYPLDELLIMHRLTQEKAIELHGCGIVRADGIGNLFVGHSGAGKSTTTRLWTVREDVEVLSDDRIIVRRDDAPDHSLVTKMPRLASSSGEGKGILRLRDQSASPTGCFAQDDKTKQQIPRSARNDRNYCIRNGKESFARNDEAKSDKNKIRMYGTPWHGEAMYASPNSAPLAQIFILEHGHGNVLTQLSPPQAVAELFARSFVPFHRHEYVDSALQFLQEVVDTVPVYRYAFEPDQRAVDTILNLHD